MTIIASYPFAAAVIAVAMPVFPVDTHIHRIARRLKWIGPKVSAEKSHDLLEPAIAAKDLVTLIYTFIERLGVTKAA